MRHLPEDCNKEGGRCVPKGRVIGMESGQWESTLCTIVSRPNVIKNISERNYFDGECACLYPQRRNEEEIGPGGVAMMAKWSSVLNPSFVIWQCVKVLKIKSNVNIRDSIGIKAPIPESESERDECERVRAGVVRLSLELSKLILSASDPSMWLR